MIELKQLTKSFKQKNGQLSFAVDTVDLVVPEGKICVFLGPSGCGKTTTLKMINRLVTPTSGKILLNGVDTETLDAVQLRRTVGYVIQQIGLFPNMTIEQNITVVPRLLGWDKKRCRERASELMSMVALDPSKYLNRYPRELSGGQQQRVGVIRALAADPPVLLMDEPFGAVDPINRESIQNEFLQMQRALGKTVLVVSHDIDEAIKLADFLAVFQNGKLVQYDTPDAVLAKPANEFVANFVGHDRTLKRLLLVKASDAAQTLPNAHPDTSLSAAREMMDENDARHLVVTNSDGLLLGFVKWRDTLDNTKQTCSECLRLIENHATASDNLRIILSLMYERNLSWLPVITEDGTYCGEVTQDSIAAYLSSGRSHHAFSV